MSNVITQVFQQYRDLRLNGSKFFYYSYGKLDVRFQSIERDNYGSSIREALGEGKFDLKVRVHFSELEDLFQTKRIQKRDIEKMKQDLIRNSHFEIVTDEITDVFFIYERISINTRQKYIDVYFNEYAIILHELTSGYPFTKIIFEDVMHLSSKYQINLYTYAMTILRKGGGIITRDIDDLREILAKDNNSDDYVFLNRFVTTPAKEISDNKDIGIVVNTKREGRNVHIRVNNKKEWNNG